jgi:predicted AAA+ superfamily ATPase
VSGMRQVGKSTLLQHLAPLGRRHVTLDEYADLELAQSAPKAFFMKSSEPPSSARRSRHAFSRIP